MFIPNFDRVTRIGTKCKSIFQNLHFKYLIKKREKKEKESNHIVFETAWKANLSSSKSLARVNYEVEETSSVSKGKEEEDSASCLALSTSLEVVLFFSGHDNKGVINKPRLRY